ncbi:PAS domain-containing sensor histidine kinase [Carboxylicivirga sp. RSCT41]|uniref:sensor histidine kinase n=1 Tax=Carboxylicivirga agarovorans TaxID=3417570 RepID=UPI003D33E4E7
MMDESELSKEGLINKDQGHRPSIKCKNGEDCQFEETNSNLNALINNQDASIWSIDCDYNYVIFNDYFKNAYKETFGITLEKGLNSLKILSPELAAYWKEKYDTALKGHQISFEFNNEHNNIVYTFKVSLNPVISNNTIIGVSALSVDITEQKSIKQSLLENNTNMMAIMENTLESIWAINTSYEILYSNSVFTREFYNSFGVRLERGSNLLKSLPEVLQPIWKARYDRALNNERFSFVDEIDIGDKIIYIEVSMNPIIRDNKVIGASFFANDISRRVNALKALEENEQRLKESNITKDKFFSIIAHDLKSPFTSIAGLSDLLVCEAQNGRNFENLEDTAKIIQKSSHQAMNLITNLLEWSRSQSGRMTFCPDHFDVTSILQEELSAFEAIAKQKQIKISNTIETGTIIFADRYMISSIFRNLISNALKFTNTSGKISITSQITEAEISFSVADSGVGIDIDDLPKLFVIDQNHSTAGTENEQGTGLGLILCKEFAEKHQGHIWAKSEKNKGSEFCFSLPHTNQY